MTLRLLVISISILAFGLPSCTYDEVEPSETASWESCLAWVDGEFQDIPLDAEPEYLAGGADSLIIHVLKSIRYPAEARENGIQGLTRTSFEINEAGVVENIMDAGSDHQILSDASIEAFTEVFEGGIKFTPAMLDGASVRVQKVILVRYKLQ